MMATYDGQTTASGWASAGYSTGNMTNTMSALSSASVVSQKLPIIGNLAFIAPAVNFMSALFNTVIWNFSFVQPYPFVARILNIFGIIGLMMLFRMLYSIIRGNVAWG